MTNLIFVVFLRIQLNVSCIRINLCPKVKREYKGSKQDHDYPDFDSGEVDIQLILKEMESDEETRKMLSSDFSDIILAFDFDPHHDHPRFDTVMKMLEFYVDSTDMGKLYINYPMMQPFKHFFCFT